MEIPKITTRVVYSKKNFAWNVVGTQLGAKYKIARVPYLSSMDQAVFNGKHYCPECYSWDSDDNLIIDKNRTK